MADHQKFYKLSMALNKIRVLKSRKCIDDLVLSSLLK